MQTNNFSELSMSISHISEERGYWLFRSHGGTFYKDFLASNFIAIGYNEITLKDLTFGTPEQISARIKEKLDINYELKPRALSYAANQLIRFASQIKKGDVVIVPDVSSRILSYGIIDSESPYMADEETQGQCYFLKRWKVNWEFEELKQRLNPKLYPIFSSHHIITDISKYAPYIDSTISDLYIKEDKVHVVINIQTDKPILTSDFSTFCEMTNFFINDFEEYIGGSIDEEQEIKIALQSKGKVEIISKSVAGIMALSLIMNACLGGSIKISAGKTKMEIESPGLSKTITQYLDDDLIRQQNAIIFEQSMKSMEVDSINDVQQLLDLHKTINGDKTAQNQ